MRYMTFAMAFGVGLALYPAAQARHSHHHRPVVVGDTPLSVRDSSWPVDYNIVPRYRYRPQDDCVDSYGPPVSRHPPLAALKLLKWFPA
jgi:hypothetical protein